ncbi:MAG: S-layer homology domain-containing protein [Bacillota bacterium]
MKRRLFLSVLVALSVFLVLAVSSPVATHAGETAEILLQKTVDYYTYQHTSLEHWEEVVGLDNAGVEVDKPPWTLPSWNVDSLKPTSLTTDYAGVILGMLAAGQDPSDVDGRDIIQELASRQTDAGDFGAPINQTIWAVIALDTAKGSYNTSKAVAYLISQQKAGGGYALSGDAGDPDTTGMALIALANHLEETGVWDAVYKARGFLKNVQLPSAGFGSPENTESIASVIRGLSACGEDITAAAWQKDGRTMIHALIDFRLADNSFAHIEGGGSDPIATRQALIALGDLVKHNVSVDITSPGTGTDPGIPAAVKVRVEGASDSKAEKTVTGCIYALDALKAAVGEENVVAPGGFVTSILGESGLTGAAPGIDTYWMYYVIRDGTIEPSAFLQGAATYKIADGDEVVFYIGALDSTWAAKTYFPVVTVNPPQPQEGQTVTLSVYAVKYDWGSGLTDLTAAETAAIGEYTVTANGSAFTTQNGRVAIPNVPKGELNFTVTNPNASGYPDVVTYKGKITVNPASGGSSDGGTICVTVEVTGKNKETLYPSTAMYLPTGTTALDALKATGLSVTHDSSGFVRAINGVYNEGVEGWKYSVNGIEPSVSAKSTILQNNDSMRWYWGSAYDSGPSSAPDNSGNQGISPAVVAKPGTQTINVPGIVTSTADGRKSVLASVYTELLAQAATGLAPGGVVTVNVYIPDNAAAVETRLPGSGLQALAGKDAVLELIAGDWTYILPLQALDLEKAASVLGMSGGNLYLTIEMSEPPAEIEKAINKLAATGGRKLLAVPVEFRVWFSTLDGKLLEQNDFGGRFVLRSLPLLGGVVPEQSTGVVVESDGFYPVPTVFMDQGGRTYAWIRSNSNSIYTVIQQERSFSDLQSHWARRDIETMASKLVVHGVTRDAFDPDAALTRAQLTAMLVRALGLRERPGETAPFKDVAAGAWYSNPVEAACAAGLVKGTGRGRFAPEEPATRETLAALAVAVMRVAGQEPDMTAEEEKNLLASFEDGRTTSPWAMSAVAKAVKSGVIKGYPDGTLRSKQITSRSEGVAVIKRLLETIKFI